VTPGNETLLLAAVKAKRTPYIDSYQQALALLASGNNRDEARKMMLDVVYPKLLAYHDALDAFDQYESSQIDRVVQQSGAQYITGRREFLFSLAVAGLLTLGIAAFTVMRMNREIEIRHRAERTLQEAYGLLEQRIQERTVDLKKANEALRAEVNERKLAEERLKRLRAERETILNSITEGVHWVGDDGLVKFENPASAKMLGYEPSEMIGKPGHPTIHHSHADGTPYPVSECPLYATWKDGVVRRVKDEVFWRKDGTSFPVEYTCSAARDENNRLAGAVMVFTDVTERKVNEQQLKAQHALSDILMQSATLEEARAQVLQTLCENLGWDAGGIWLVDHRANVMRCTQIWSKPGIDIKEFKLASDQTPLAPGVGLPGRIWSTRRPVWIQDIAHDPNFPRYPATIQAGLHGAVGFPVLMGKEVAAVVELFSRNPRACDVNFLPGLATLGNQLGQFLQRKQLEGHLLESQKMKTVGRLAGGVAHEYNSILTAIIGQSELLLSDLAPDSPMATSAREIRRAADRAATLTRQLLAYGRKQILQPEVLNLNQVLAEMLGTLQHLMGRDLDIRITPCIGLKTVKIDPGQLELILVNMATNAADAMPKGGRFSLETANVTLDEAYVRPYPGLKTGDYVMLTLSDTGSGMSEETKARVFEPFFTTKKVGQGTGLGLATCYGIIKQSDGHISVSSEPGRGTTFKIYLPEVEMPAQAPLPYLKSLDLPRGTETIFLAEDDPSLLEMSASFLRRQGYTVHTAVSSLDALSLKNRRVIGPIDLLLTDVVMPHMSGKELSDRLLAIDPHTRILFTSAFSENAIVSQGILKEGVNVLQKPFTPSALAQKIRQVLDQPVTPPAPDRP